MTKGAFAAGNLIMNIKKARKAGNKNGRRISSFMGSIVGHGRL